MFTRSLKELSKADVKIAGGKGSSLGELMRIGIQVPPGFVVVAKAWDKFLSDVQILPAIHAIMRDISHEDVHCLTEKSQAVQAMILSSVIPRSICLEIHKRFDELKAKYVAVRSSAMCEDSASEAWAGQLDTYLNTGRKDLLANVHKCWASVFSPQALSYRLQKSLRSRYISTAVVVQAMVQSEVSGTAFSVHPVTQNPGHILIEAAYGLGEALVSGEITPDSYVIGKKLHRIEEKNTSLQKVRLVRAEKGGYKWKKVDSREMKRQKLCDAHILHLCDLVLTIEKHYGFPCDIEWALERKKLYIVQSRPITTLKSKGQNPMSSLSITSALFEAG